MKTTIKFCGITREQDARVAIALGVNALGFVFCEKSKRNVTIEQLDWLKRLPAFVQLTGLFVNPTERFVRDVTRALPIGLLQFHGDESAAFCEQFSQRYIKAVPMQDLKQQAAHSYMQKHPNACGFLLDNYGVSEIGGSGTAFAWEHIPSDTPAPLIMAGGLDTDNVASMIQTIKPYGVDVSSSIEERPGIKSTEKMTAFVRAVKRAECTKSN